MSGAQMFANELAALIDRYREEADLSFVEVVGILEIAKAGLEREAIEHASEDEDGDD